MLFLTVIFLGLVAMLCGPIWLGQRVMRHAAAEREARSTLTPEQLSARMAEQWRGAGRRAGGFLFWTWCMLWGALLVFLLWAYTQIG